MDKKDFNYTAWGMLLGTFVGGGVGTLLLATTGDALYLIVAGIGTALGLIFGAGLDSAKQDRGNE